MPQPIKKPKINLEYKEQFKEDPKLFFPTKYYNGFEFLDNDITQIDDSYINTFNSCRTYDRNYGSKIFWEKFKNSKEITIIDKHLSDRELTRIFNVVEHWERENLLKEQIKFVSIYLYKPRMVEGNKIFYKMIKEILGEKFKVFSTKDNEDTLIHDRFAILDGETFHFGGTVGGYQQGFTAFSCGWSDKGILKLFDYLIKNHLIYEVKNL